MKIFLDDNFLLNTSHAEKLYHGYAKNMPIIDYHNHLPPEEIFENKNFENITQIWLQGDHYKWRAMRAFGIDERYITGDATDKEKFLKWAETVPHTLRNPLYHWTHLELQRYFGITELLNPSTAESIYEKTADLLQRPEYAVQILLKKMKVEVACTTDDPLDDLKYHQPNKAGIGVYPTFRPDKAMAVQDVDEFNNYLEKLKAISNFEINTYAAYIEAIQARHDYFHEKGCRLSDHGISAIEFSEFTHGDIAAIFQKIIDKKELYVLEVKKIKTSLLLDFAKMDHESGWTQQFHLGALRNTNTRKLRELGPDTGYDSIGDFPQAVTLSKFFDTLEGSNQLAKTILYNLNPSDNEVFATMVGNYNDGSIKGKMQFGSGWWYLDQLDGMEKQMNALSNIGLLSCFVGMLTDSRSFLSFPRHEYFRRLLCNMLGNDIENGLIPNDEKLIGSMVQNICYNNAKEYFNFINS